jgi:predicted permease
MESLWLDIRYGLRTLLRNPGFTIISAITLALGIGVNTAVFSIVNSVLLRPLPVRDPGQIYVLSTQQNELSASSDLQSATGIFFSIPEFHDIRSQSAGVYSETMASTFGIDGLNISGKAERVISQYVSGNFFTGLGISAAAGRLILPTEGETPMADPVLVLSYNYWQTRFAGDPGVVGRKVSLNGHPLTVVGVASKDFTGINPLITVECYLPLSMNLLEGTPAEVFTNRQARNFTLMTRLRSGVTSWQAQAALDVIAQRMSETNPKDDKGLSIRAYPELRARPQPDPHNTSLVVSGLFLGLTSLVLLLACVNVANILLVRSGVRSREMAIRTALGAARSRLIRRLLVESILLGLAGGAAGMALGWIGNVALGSIPTDTDLVTHFQFHFDWRVFAFAFGAALLTGVVVGIVPAIRASRGSLAAILHQGGRTMAGGRQRFRHTLVTAQVGASLMLLIIAGLFAHSLARTQRLPDLGFDPEHLLNLSMDPNEIGYTEAEGREFYKNLLERVRALPGIESATTADSVPMGYYNNFDTLTLEGYEPPPGQPAPNVSFNAVSTDYWKTLRIRVLRGRLPSDADNEKSPYVAVVNEAMAKAFWPHAEAIGRHFSLGSEPAHSIEVVGVVANSRFQGMAGPILPYFYVPLAQHYSSNSLQSLQVRTVGDPRAAIPEIEQMIESLAPELSVFDVKTMTQALDTLNGLLFYKLGAALAAVFGILGLALAVVGVYGVISYAAAERTHEIGIRLALGAQRQDILKLIFAQGLAIVGLGLVVGIAAALAAARLVGSFLTVSALDPVAYFGASFALAFVALLACYIPARRAMHVDPMVALRYE